MQAQLSRTSGQQRLVTTGGRVIKHAWYYWLLLAEGHLHRLLLGQMLRQIWALPVPSAQHADCGCKIWGRGRRVGAVCGKSIPRQQAGLVRQARNEPSEPR
jgi:hypothetical protein